MRTEARDFLENPIKKGDWIVYPTGGTSARMVLAKVLEVEDLEELYRKGEQEAARKGDNYYYGTRSVSDGHRGNSQVRLVVSRFQEGTRKASDDRSYWKIDTKRKVRIDQLHRVIVVPKPKDLDETI